MCKQIERLSCEICRWFVVGRERAAVGWDGTAARTEQIGAKAGKRNALVRKNLTKNKKIFQKVHIDSILK